MPPVTPPLLRPMPGYAQRRDGPAPPTGLKRWWVGVQHAARPHRPWAWIDTPGAEADTTGAGAPHAPGHLPAHLREGPHERSQGGSQGGSHGWPPEGLHQRLCTDLLNGRLACAPDAPTRWAALAASIRHFAAAGLPVHVVAADAEAADAAHARLAALGLEVGRLDPKATPRARRRQYAAGAAVAEVLPWARDLLHDTAVVGERPRAVQMLLERGVASEDTDSRLDRVLLPGRPVLVVLDPQVTLLDGAQVPVALQAGRALPGLAPDTVVQRSVQALLQAYRHVCGLTDRLGRHEADELALDCCLPMGRSVTRWAPPGWPVAASWQASRDDEVAWSQQLAWARKVTDGAGGKRSPAWLLCTSGDSARSLQQRLDSVDEATRGIRAMTWAAAREAAARATADARPHALAVEWPTAPLLALQCLRQWSAARDPLAAPRFDGGIVPPGDRIVAAWRQVARARTGHRTASGAAHLHATDTPIDADALLAWQLRERAQARRQMLQNEAGMRQLLAFAGGSIG